MTKVITYGTYDLLHYGHIKLLERAKALGDYLIVGVTADDFDKTRGKINVQQTLMERIEAVRATGLADEIIVEEYEGQKIDDIKRYGVDIFTVGSDWVGYFDYLKEFCEVVYLDRTKGVSSSDLRAGKNDLRIGLIGEASSVLNKFISESRYVNGVSVVGVCAKNKMNFSDELLNLPIVTDDYALLLDQVDAVYVLSHPSKHYIHIKQALESGKHVLCESPFTLNVAEYEELQALATDKGLYIMEAIKTAYSTAYNRMILLAKSGKIGDVISVDAICTSLRDINYFDRTQLEHTWSSITSWGPTALLPVLQLLGNEWKQKKIVTRVGSEEYKYDEFTSVTFIYPHAIASIKVGKGVKSEGELVISGTKGYIYVPAPWWKTDYFEIRYENSEENKRYFYQLDGEGIRNEIVSFVKSIQSGNRYTYINETTTKKIVSVMADFYNKIDVIEI
ncbi:MAG: adenylyltransferase/cytidyltransferase family protein [Paludibacteraceae bacterium]|nr:adenylyltransferase/cytidyltransferase family protein [Paludibacteraceae bacterium]